MSALQPVFVTIALLLVAVCGTAVVVTRDPERQAVTLSLLGVAFVVLLVVLQAPDVALSQLAVGSAVVPLMVMLAWRRMRKDRADRAAADDGGSAKDGDG